MSPERESPDFVIRMADVRLGRREMELALGVPLDRHEPSRAGSLHYAQISLDHDGDRAWSSVAAFLESVGPKVRALIERGAIGSASMDMAIHFPDNMAALSSMLPAHIALLAGQNLIDVEVSVYLTSAGK